MNPRGRWERQALREEESLLRAAPEGDEGEKNMLLSERRGHVHPNVHFSVTSSVSLCPPACSAACIMSPWLSCNINVRRQNFQCQAHTE